MGQQFKSSKTWKKLFVSILNIFVNRDIFVLFFVYQDNEEEY